MDQPTICLIVPSFTYTKHLKTRADRSLRRKIKFLESSLLFQHWPVESVYQVAHFMRQRTVESGHTLVRRGDPMSDVVLVSSGEIKVFINHSTGNAPTPNAPKNHRTINAIEVALLGPGEVFGACEAFLSRAKMRRSAMATCLTEVFEISVHLWQALVMTQERTHQLVAKLVEHRTQWERLRRSYVASHPDEPTRVTYKMMNFAKYSLTRASIMSAHEIREAAKWKKTLEHGLRESRQSFKSAFAKKQKAEKTRTKAKLEEALVAFKGCLDAADRAVAAAAELGAAAATPGSAAETMRTGARGHIKDLEVLLAGADTRSREARSSRQSSAPSSPGRRSPSSSPRSPRSPAGSGRTLDNGRGGVWQGRKVKNAVKFLRAVETTKSEKGRDAVKALVGSKGRAVGFAEQPESRPSSNSSVASSATIKAPVIKELLPSPVERLSDSPGKTRFLFAGKKKNLKAMVGLVVQSNRMAKKKGGKSGRRSSTHASRAPRLSLKSILANYEERQESIEGSAPRRPQKRGTFRGAAAAAPLPLPPRSCPAPPRRPAPPH